MNLADRTLEVYREPRREGRAWLFRTVERLGPDATVTPLASPAARIPVADLLP